MNLRKCTFLLLLVALIATRLLDVHFHLPPASSAEQPHLVAQTLIAVHHHADEADHGHIAAHLYEGEADEDKGTGLLGKVGSSTLAFVPVLLGLLLLSWRLAASRPLLPRTTESPPRPRQWARLAPPSQAPPLQA